MKYLLSYFLVLSVFAFIIPQNADGKNTGQPVRIITYNIRNDNPDDKLDSWQYRKEHVAALVGFYGADIFCLQEGLSHQVSYLQEKLKDYGHYGLGRDDGKTQGEYSAIFFNKNRFSLIDENSFWLSEDCTKPGKGWDAACIRICSWIELKDKQTGKKLFVFNTHFDHMGKTAREESAKLILKKINEFAKGKQVILTGDFNSNPEDASYKTIVSQKEGNVRMSDSRKISATPHYGPENTFCGGFLTSGTEELATIDYIFVTSEVKVLKHATLSDSSAGHFYSDHMPVLADIIF
jgi:endonuclease/exonuclease/phosphatase family metal-dependent hydrolase